MRSLLLRPRAFVIGGGHGVKFTRCLSSAAVEGEYTQMTNATGAGLDRMSLKGVKLGSGGRMSQAGLNVAVFGATGFLGQYVVNELGRVGTNLVVTTRTCDMSWRHLKVCADYGKLVPSYIHLKDEKTIVDTIRGCDVVVNLMGKEFETAHYLPHLINCSFEDVNVTGAELVARIAREQDVKHLVHVSCAYADPNSKSRSARTKAEGEKRVKEQFPGAVIVRPNVFYGEEDNFLNLAAWVVQKFPAIPLVEGGAASMKPVYVGDLGTAIAGIANNYETAGETFNLSGNDTYTWREVHELVVQHTLMTQANKGYLDIPLKYAEIIGDLVNLFPNPPVNKDSAHLRVSDCPGPEPSDRTFVDIGMDEISDFETKSLSFLYRFRKGGHFAHLRHLRRLADGDN